MFILPVDLPGVDHAIATEASPRRGDRAPAELVVDDLALRAGEHVMLIGKARAALPITTPMTRSPSAIRSLTSAGFEIGASVIARAGRTTCRGLKSRSLAFSCAKPTWTNTNKRLRMLATTLSIPESLPASRADS